ncbi:hypothetical protein KY284_017015 [Solanum tuberosum]|nr:hypothetical protein KY284_017015 [Solanum tuberosum]
MSSMGCWLLDFQGVGKGVTMSSSHRPGKKVATSSNRKRVRSGNVPPAPALPRGQTSLAHEFPQIRRQIRELCMEFIFADPDECNLHMVRKFYSNWTPEAQSHYVTVHGKNVPITPTYINDILGTPEDTDLVVLTRLNIYPPYQAVRHMLCGPQSIAQWTKHSEKRYHKSLPYARMLWETRVWLKVVMNYLIPGLHYTDITCDRVCLVYALMTGMKLNIGAIIKSSMRKARVHKEHRYAFCGLITKMCCVAGVPEENLDYMAPLYPASVDITRTKGPDTNFGPILTTAERHRRDELIMFRMRYLLNYQAKALLGISPEFRELTENDILTDEENLRTGSDVESDSDEDIDPIQAEAEANGGDITED